MLIIGERINTTRKTIEKAVLERNTEVIQKEAVEQVRAGAEMLDVNCGTLPADAEPEALVWLVKTAQEATGVPLCVDSANPRALEAALAVHNGKPMINSISGERDRYGSVIRLVRQYDASVIALGLGDQGIPKGRDQALEMGVKLVEALLADGVPLDDIYFDPLVRSLATDTRQTKETLDLMEAMISRFPGMHLVSGVSNVSFGLPERYHLNRAFVVLAIASGLDAAIIDPLDRTLVALISAAEALMNKDPYCRKYIEAYRQGRLKVGV